MGLSPRTAWNSSAVLYGGGGLLVTLLYAIDPATFASGVFYLGCVAVAIGALCILAGRHLNDSNRVLQLTTHARLIAGFAIFVTAVLIMHGKVVAFALIPLLIVPTPCYLYSWRLALPYVVGGALLVFFAQLPIDGPAHVAHALISTSAFAVIAAAMIVTKQRTQLLARHNRGLAYIDPLTGIANMRSLRERISVERERPSGDGRSFALFAMDMDNFKQVNDQFDHSMGDSVLSAIAEAICGELEPGDLPVRRGGDEFAVLAPDPSARDLDGMRDGFERAIARARIATCPQVTPSGSVAYIRTDPGEELGAMMERADEALHHAKLASRKRRAEASPARAELRDAREMDDNELDGTALGLQGAQAEGTSVERARPAHVPTIALAAKLERSNPDWTFAALLLFLGSLATASVSLGQLVEPLEPLAGTGIAAAFLALSLGCTWAGVSGLSPRWLHAPWLAAYGLLALAIKLAGPSGTALLDLIPAIVMYGFLVFKARTAALYLLLGQGMYGAFAIAQGFDQGVARTVITTVVVAVVGGLVAKLRLVTIRVARANRELSEVDALTGVGNLRALRDRVSDVVDRAPSRPLGPLAIAIDLDSFKQVNDLYSHSIGDRVLVAVARTITERVRIDALVARRGGDEFVVVLEDADPQYAETVVQRIDDAIIRARSRICPDLRATASVTSVPWRPGETANQFLHEVDVALHAKKAESRAPASPQGAPEEPAVTISAGRAEAAYSG